MFLFDDISPGTHSAPKLHVEAFYEFALVSTLSFVEPWMIYALQGPSQGAAKLRQLRFRDLRHHRYYNGIDRLIEAKHSPRVLVSLN